MISVTLFANRLFEPVFLFAEACMTIFLKPHTVLRRLAVDAYGDC